MKLVDVDLRNLYEFTYEYIFFGAAKSGLIICPDSECLTQIIDYFKDRLELCVGVFEDEYSIKELENECSIELNDPFKKEVCVLDIIINKEIKTNFENYDLYINLNKKGLK